MYENGYMEKSEANAMRFAVETGFMGRGFRVRVLLKQSMRCRFVGVKLWVWTCDNTNGPSCFLAQVTAEMWARYPFILFFLRLHNVASLFHQFKIQRDVRNLYVRFIGFYLYSPCIKRKEETIINFELVDIDECCYA